jgi:DNA-binding CsgD family transcriptional regulator
MFPAKNALAHQINPAIKKKWNRECTEIPDRLIASDNTHNIYKRIGEKYPLQNANAPTLKRMKKRIEVLEELSDHLYNYVCYLLENLPELVIKTIQANFKTDHSFDQNVQSPKNGSEKVGIENKAMLPFPTRREKDVLELLEKGYYAKEIATRLFISEATVITHKKNLKNKYKVKNTVELISKFKSAR